ncbi:oxidoreductase, partial [Burkholderia sp. 3C]
GAGPHSDAISEGPSRAAEHTAAMSDADIADTIDAFARAAVAAREAGFDAVEVHGAHGYLIDQFAWPVTNRRADAYGGDAAGRMRLAAEVVRAIRREAGALPILFRFSQWKLQDYGARLAHTPQELEQLLAPIVDAGADLLHASTRRYWQPEFDGSPLGLAGWAKQLTGLPTIMVGSVGLEGGDVVGALREGEHAATVGPLAPVEARLAAGECDLVAVGRALIANPDWANLVAAQRLDALRPFDKGLLATL